MSSRMFLVIGCGLLCLTGPAHAQADRPIPDQLLLPVEFPAIDDARTTLTDALTGLTRRHGVLFKIHDRAFKEEQVMDVGRTEIASPEPLPEMKGLRLKTVLQTILNRVPAPTGATYLVRDGYVEITTNAAARTEIWGDNHPGPFFPLVNLKAQDRSLAELFDEVATQGPSNVAIDPRAKGKLDVKVTTRLHNAPTDTALDVLADMAGLRVIRLRNVFYVTTPERVVEIRKKQADDEKATPRPYPAPGGM